MLLAMFHAGSLHGSFIICLYELAVNPSLGESRLLNNSQGLALLRFIFLPNSCRKGKVGQVG